MVESEEGMADSKTELKPCPWCGGKAQVMKMDLGSIEEGWQVWGVWCVDDLHAEEHGGYQHGHFIDNHATEAEAIEAWNTRTPEQAIAATLGAGECENVAEGWGVFECSGCGFYADFGSDLHRARICPDCGKAVKR